MIILLVAFLIVLYVINRLTWGRTRSPTCLVGKTALVTGGNSGIGYQVCLDLASRGCKVIIADKDDSEQSTQRIIKETNNPNVTWKKVNLASFKSVRQFAAEILQSETRLDILVNNAGIGYGGKVTSEDGLELTMQVNYYGPFLLTHLLIDLLKKSAPSRIIFTSSLLAFCGDVTDLSPTKGSTIKSKRPVALYPYCDSKLATVMASDILAEKLKNVGITSNSLHPGYVRTTIYRKAAAQQSPFWAIVTMMMPVFAYIVGKDSYEGAQTTIHLAVSQSVKNTTGQYFGDCRSMPKPPQAQNKEVARKVWLLSEKLVGLKPEEKI